MDSTSKNTDESGINTAVSPLVAPAVGQALERTQLGKYHTPGGHGFAAEDANHFADLIAGRNPELAGLNNELNGPDRIAGGVKIQSKYFQTPTETVASAFDSTTGAYRYAGQVLEVPMDQYDECVKLMQKRISKGQVSGVTNPAEAESLIRKGTITYKQARNIARAGNIASILFDAKTQGVTSAGVFALSFLVSVIQNEREGKPHMEAIHEAVFSGLASGGASFVTGVATAQILRTRTAALGAVAIRSGVKAVSGTSVGREVIQHLAAGSLRKAVYGAAAVNHVSKLLRTNTVTAAITTVVTATPDLYRAAFSKSISWTQFTKNLTVNVAGVAGGTAGWMGGAALGATIGSVIPVVGTAAGGLIGGVLGAVTGGTGSSMVAKKIADKIADDDVQQMTAILEDVISTLAFEYLLTQAEVELIAMKVKEVASSAWLQEMFKAGKSNRQNAHKRREFYVRETFELHFMAVLKDRQRVELPAPEIIEKEMSEVIAQLGTHDEAA